MKDKDCIFCKIANGEIPSANDMFIIFILFRVNTGHH